jgi:hypothetical protein
MMHIYDQMMVYYYFQCKLRFFTLRKRVCAMSSQDDDEVAFESSLEVS